MDYRRLGRSGCAVSNLCLGTMTFGVETDEAGAHEQLDRFVAEGGTLVDTADVYGSGRSGGGLGRWSPPPPPGVAGAGGAGPQGPVRHRPLPQRGRPVGPPPDPGAGHVPAPA